MSDTKNLFKKQKKQNEDRWTKVDDFVSKIHSALMCLFYPLIVGLGFIKCAGLNNMFAVFMTDLTLSVSILIVITPTLQYICMKIYSWFWS